MGLMASHDGSPDTLRIADLEATLALDLEVEPQPLSIEEQEFIEEALASLKGQPIVPT
jgi:hypothetical protein